MTTRDIGQQILDGIREIKEHKALLTLVRLHEQSPARDLRGKLHREGDLGESRQSRTNAGN
jgi:hypothetical protein